MSPPRTERHNGLGFSGRRCIPSLIIAFPSVPLQTLVIQRNLSQKNDRTSPYPTHRSPLAKRGDDCLNPNLKAFHNFHGSLHCLNFYGSLQVVMAASAIYDIFEWRSSSYLQDGYKPFTKSLSRGVFSQLKMSINGHYQNLNHSQFFEPESDLNRCHSPSFFATV
jgi:hypothetical protein